MELPVECEENKEKQDAQNNDVGESDKSGQLKELLTIPSNGDIITKEHGCTEDTVFKSEARMEDTSSGVNGTHDSNNSKIENQANSEPLNTSGKKSRPSSENGNTPANKVAKVTPRSTRSSENPDFAAKQRKFLNRVHDPIGRGDSENDTSINNTPVLTKSLKVLKSKSVEKRNSGSDLKRKFEKIDTPKKSNETDEDGSAKKKRLKEPTKVVGGVDSYCWRCHRDGNVILCQSCPRVYHLKCVQMEAAQSTSWDCPECKAMVKAESPETRSRAMNMMTMDQFCNLLQFAINRMIAHEGADDFMKAVDVAEFPNYREYIVKPMDLTQLRRNIKAKMYCSTEAFLAEAKWMLHNSIIFNSVQSKFTNTARALLKICRQEIQEIENCPDCYKNAHVRSSDSWFIEACRHPHLLVWAKLKGFPFWPAKAMSTNSDNLVDVRFFGAHDRAWVPVSSCFLFSKLPPAPSTNKNRRNIEDCLQELECHIKKLKDKFGQFEYAPFKTPYDPSNEAAQLAIFLPKYETRNSNVKSRMSLHNDGARKAVTTNNVDKSKSQAKQSTPVLPMISVKDDEPQDDITPTKPGVSPGKKTYKTPLTAGAKKCFASEEPLCIKCQRSNDSGSPLCSVCSKVPQEDGSERVKECANCVTKSSNVWHEIESGLIYCDICIALQQKNTNQTIEVQIKRPIDPNDTIRGTVTIQRKLNDVNTAKSLQMDNDEPAAMDHEAEKQGVDEVTADSDSVEIITPDPPPVLSINEVDGNECSEEENKTIVDRLSERLYIDADGNIKQRVTTEVNETSEISLDGKKQPENNSNVKPEENIDQPKVIQVLLHDLKNDKNLMGIIKESEITMRKATNESTNELSPNGAENTEPQPVIDTESESDIDSTAVIPNSTVVEDGSSTKKKQNNINDLVKSIKERKSSIDDKVEKIGNTKNTELKGNTKNTELKETSLIIDDNDDGPVLVIDESDLNENDDKKSSVKPDKNRRKGVPAKMFSRISTESETSSIEDQSKLLKGSKGVLDEVSGQFRRPSTDMTITLVTDDDEEVQNKTKEVLSVNISKSLSLSVVNKPSENMNMEIETVDSDLEEQVVVDSVIKKVNPRPTARKTMKGQNLPLLQENKRIVTDESFPNTLSTAVQVTTPPPLYIVRPSQTSQEHNSKEQEPSPAMPSTAPTRTDLGPAQSVLDQAAQKLSGQFRAMIEDILRNVSQSGVPEAAVQTLQMDLEREQWKHRQEISELKHNTDLLVMEIRASLEAEKQRALLDAKHKYEIEKEQAIQETKRKPWCAYCQKEAQLYCCWNTAYCSYDCQQSHWIPHMNTCLNEHQGNSNTTVSPRVAQPRPQNYISPGQMHEPLAWSKEDPQKPGARRRCGGCRGCTAEPCGECYGCTHPKCHTVCKARRCSFILNKNPQRVRQQMMPSNPQSLLAYNQISPRFSSFPPRCSNGLPRTPHSYAVEKPPYLNSLQQH